MPATGWRQLQHRPAPLILVVSPHSFFAPASRVRRAGSGRMPRAGFDKAEFTIDTGSPFLNHTVDGFLKIGAVGVCKVAAEDAFECLHKGNVSMNTLEETLKKMCKEGAYWGTVAGVYVGMEYGMERVLDRHDWKNAAIGGALTGALISIASSKKGDNIVKDAITGGAIATAVEFINHLT